ncbi:MAG TPA: TRAP transporter permease [Clostridia bacterium]|nr:TRAP transporter permease [Clostridia bacterium]
MLEELLKSPYKRDPYTRVIIWLFIIVAISLSLFHMYLSGFGVLEAWRQRSIHLTLILLLVFLIPNQKEALKKVKYSIWDLICLFATIGVGAYSVINYSDIVYRGGMPNTADQVVAFIITGLVIEAVRRKCGWAVVIVTGIFLLYGFFGYMLPGYLGHPNFTIAKICDQIYNSSAGIFGVPLAAAADFIIMFIIFGAFLIHTKAGEYFTLVAYAIAGRQRGGPAKAAVIASALVGTIHGSGPGNVVTTGSFTIPMMKKVGYEAKFAAGVEAAASTGGILMPPVMGSAAFIMAAITGIPYGKIIIYAAIPAVLYFASVFWMTHLEAAKMGLNPLNPEEIPDLGKTMKSTWPLLFPLIALIYMLVSGASASRAALISTLLLVVLFIIKKEDRLTWQRFLFALESGATSMVSISVICAAAGIIVGMISLTGLGVKLGAVVMILAQGKLILALVLTGLTAMILGMGMPGVAAYIIVASTIAPALVKLGVPIMAAHLFAYYLSQMSAITPPVALSSYAAAAIAGSGLWETGWVGFKMAAAGLIVPFMFIYSPTLLLDGSFVQIVWSVITSLIGTFALASGLVGFLGKCKLSMAYRVIVFFIALLLIDQGLLTDALGILTLLAVYLITNKSLKSHSKSLKNMQ